MNKTTKIILINIIAIIAILLFLWNPIRHIVKNHPYEYVYFNELVGGINKAYGNYEMDYYYHSTREAAEWVIANAEKSGLENGEKIKVATWHVPSVEYFFRHDTADFQVLFSRWYERGNNDWDYAIFAITGIVPEELKSDLFPPKNTVYTVRVDDKPICIVLKRIDRSDMIGAQYKNERELDSAVIFLQKAIQEDPTNVAAYLNIIESYFNLNLLDTAKIYIDQLLAFIPKYESGNYFLAHYYHFKQQPEEVIKICKKMITDNFKFRAAYNLAFQTYAQQGDLKNAEKMMIALMKSDQLDEQGMQQLVNVYKAQGMDERAAYKKIYKMYTKMYEERGKKKEAELYRNAAKRL